MTLDDYRLLAAEWGCQWVGQERPSDENATTQWKCRRGHEWETSYSRFNGCRTCVINAPKTEEDYHFLARLKGWKWIGGPLPQNTKTKTLWMCGEGHEFYAPYHNVRRGTGQCDQCVANEEE